MKSVLISIQPRWCELISQGKKTVEVRKTKPKIEMPFKVYIYETQGRTETPWIDEDGHEIFKGRGQVIGEFVCGNIGTTSWIKSPEHLSWVDGYDEESCLTNRELYEYSKGGIFYEWYISDLVIYDKPKELSEFKQCHKCPYGYEECTRHEYSCDGAYNVQSPPQSWCYVEVV